MADVMPSRRTAADRGQMILVAAFGVAVMLVALALILNTSIYTENIATRGSDISGGKDALQYRATTEATFAGAVREVNREYDSTNYADYENAGLAAVEDYQNLSGGHNARDGVVTNVTAKNTANWEGARVYQQDPDGNFTNEDDVANWTVVSDTDGIRNFSMNVSRSTLSGASNPTGDDTTVFYVNFSSGSDYYRVFVYDDNDNAGNVEVKVANETDTKTCSHSYGSYPSGDRAEIDFTNASIEGDHCDALEMWHPIVENPFDLHFNHTCASGGACGSSSDYNVNGSYSFVLNESYGAVNVQPGTAGPEPHLTSALYSMQVHVVYESNRLYYETDVRATPGEPDA